MRGIFSLQRKLLALWAASILLTLVSVGAIFVFLITRYHEDAAAKQLFAAQHTLITALETRAERLRVIAEALAGRDDFIASGSLLTKYQKPGA